MGYNHGDTRFIGGGAMDKSRQFAMELEWSDYARTAYFATVVPGVQVCISSEVILTTDPEVPLREGNHAAMLRTTPDCTDALIERVVKHYRECGLKPCVVISPNCAPDDLPQRLQAHGFAQDGDTEYWLTLKDPLYAEALHGFGPVTIHEIGRDGVPDFCQVMVKAYEMPEGTAPLLDHAFGYITGLPGVHNYVAYVNGEPVGCASLFSYLGYGALGSVGVLPGARHLGAAFALAARGYQDWKKDGNKALVLQTMLPKLERLLRIGGCRRVFTRTYYTLE
jgi:hypothetical protein